VREELGPRLHVGGSPLVLHAAVEEADGDLLDHGGRQAIERAPEACRAADVADLVTERRDEALEAIGVVDQPEQHAIVPGLRAARALGDPLLDELAGPGGVLEQARHARAILERQLRFARLRGEPRADRRGVIEEEAERVVEVPVGERPGTGDERSLVVVPVVAAPAQRETEQPLGPPPVEEQRVRGPRPQGPCSEASERIEPVRVGPDARCGIRVEAREVGERDLRVVGRGLG
jgi:hypothetical protein